MAKKSSRGKGALRTPERPVAPSATSIGSLPDYGLDYPKQVSANFARFGWILAFALIIFFINRQEYPGPALRMAGVIALAGFAFAAVAFYMRWSSQTGKFQLRDQLVESLALNGDEKILDAGCGRGLMAIALAKKLDSGKVTAVDHWDPERISGNSQEAIRDNAQADQVAGKLRIERGELTKLGYADGSFDVVVAVASVQDLPSSEVREKAFRELARVLKPGGRLLLYDRFAASEAAPVLQSAGMQVTLEARRLLWAMQAHLLRAIK